MEQGKVWLVGAGPSDIGLMTVKGRQVLENAQVVVYDSLVGQSILAVVPKEARLINVGKRAGNHTMPQEEINQVLLEYAQQGRRVVRLKGGDPFLFGRGGEELELLAEHQIPYEIVPGITSAISVPAYNGIPVTHRDFCSSLHIITGHKKKGAAYDIDFEALVRTKGTLVFLMGVSALEDICEQLMLAGMDKEMPAAILSQGTTARQKRIVATVETLAEAVRVQGVETPAIIVVGKVCGLAGQFQWFEKLPLSGKRIVLTRPKQLISRMSAALRELGAEVLELPTIRTEAIWPDDSFTEVLGKLESYQWLVFTSPTGVTEFFERLKLEKIDVRRLAGAKLAAIGPGSEKELNSRGFFADLIPEIYDGQHLGIALGKACQNGDRLLIPRAREGNRELANEIRARKQVVIDDIATYDTIYESAGLIDIGGQFEAGKIDYAVFTSASTVRGFEKAAGAMDYSKVRAACIGRQTKAMADALGMETYMAQKATIDSLVELILNMAEKGI